jgi:hypothetical protein
VKLYFISQSSIANIKLASKDIPRQSFISKARLGIIFHCVRAVSSLKCSISSLSRERSAVWFELAFFIRPITGIYLNDLCASELEITSYVLRPFSIRTSPSPATATRPDHITTQPHNQPTWSTQTLPSRRLQRQMTKCLSKQRRRLSQPQPPRKRRRRRPRAPSTTTSAVARPHHLQESDRLRRRVSLSQRTIHTLLYVLDALIASRRAPFPLSSLPPEPC